MVIYNKNTVCRDNPGQNILDELQLFCEIAPYEKSSISVFQESFASIDKILILEQDWAPGYNSWGFDIFLIFPNFLRS